MAVNWRQAMTSNAAYGGASSGNTSSGGSGGPAPSIDYGSDQGDGRSNAIQNQIKENQRKAAEIKANNIQKEKDKQAAIAASQANVQKENKFLTQFKKLYAEGKGNTSQAQELAKYLYGVEKKAQSGGKSIWNQGPSQPIDYSGVFPEYDEEQAMATGFGSVFGTSSGSTASSSSVQQSLEYMMNQLASQGYSPEAAASMAISKMYPKVNVYDAYGKTIKQPINLMGIPKGHKSMEDVWLDKVYGTGGGGGGGGGWGSYGYGGGYGGGGGGGGGGYYDSPAGMPRGNPNELWGAQNPLQQMMISLHGGQGFQQGFARGGIVSLVT